MLLRLINFRLKIHIICRFGHSGQEWHGGQRDIGVHKHTRAGNSQIRGERVQIELILKQDKMQNKMHIFS